MRNFFFTLNGCYCFSSCFAPGILIVDDNVFRDKPKFANLW